MNDFFFILNVCDSAVFVTNTYGTRNIYWCECPQIIQVGLLVSPGNPRVSLPWNSTILFTQVLGNKTGLHVTLQEF